MNAETAWLQWCSFQIYTVEEIVGIRNLSAWGMEISIQYSGIRKGVEFFRFQKYNTVLESRKLKRDNSYGKSKMENEEEVWKMEDGRWAIRSSKWDLENRKANYGAQTRTSFNVLDDMIGFLSSSTCGHEDHQKASGT